METESAGGKGTWWTPIFNSAGNRVHPRSAIELAVHELHRLVDDDEIGGITGGEWWLERQATRDTSGHSLEGIRFGFMMDEHLSLTSRQLIRPERVTVTFLKPSGGPLVVLNQSVTGVGPTTLMSEPTVPRRAWIVYPEANLHVSLPGHLKHGVPGVTSGMWPRHRTIGNWPEQGRCALIVNWWREAPAEEYLAHKGMASLGDTSSIFLGSGRWERLGMQRTPEALEALRTPHGHGSNSKQPGRWEPLEPTLPTQPRTLVPADLRRDLEPFLAIESPPNSGTLILYAGLPLELASPAKRGAYEVHWSRSGMVVGPVARLDWHSETNVAVLQEDKREKLIFLARPDPAAAWMSVKPVRYLLPRFVAALYSEYVDRYTFVLADASAPEAADLLTELGRDFVDTPTVFIQRWGTALKQTLPKGAALTERAVRELIDGHQNSSVGGGKPDSTPSLAIRDELHDEL